MNGKSDSPSPEQVIPFGSVLLRGRVWEIVNVTWEGADRSVGIMSDYVDSYDLEDDDGNRWNWDKDQLTSDEEKAVDAVLCKLERDYDYD